MTQTTTCSVVVGAKVIHETKVWLWSPQGFPHHPCNTLPPPHSRHVHHHQYSLPSASAINSQRPPYLRLPPPQHTSSTRASWRQSLLRLPSLRHRSFENRRFGNCIHCRIRFGKHCRAGGKAGGCRKGASCSQRSLR